jgi:mercuric ion transport protein
MSTNQAMAAPSNFGAVGLDLGWFGRILRLLLGTAMVVGILYDLSTSNPPAIFLAEAAAYFVLSLAVYAIAFYALRDRILARMNPWVGTAILLTPVLVVLVFDLGPPPFQIGINAYVGVSLILASFMRYGGCEVVAVPSLLFGKRYVVYCPYNVIDVVEKAVVDRHRISEAKGDRQAWLAAGGVLGAIASSSCCILPVVLFSLGASGAWLGNLSALSPYQPIFVAITVGFLASGFWLAYRRPKAACDGSADCAQPRSSGIVKAALWSAMLLVVAALVFPYVAPALLGV